MFDKVKLLNPNSRIWIFSSVDVLSDVEKKYINKEVSKFFCNGKLMAIR